MNKRLSLIIKLLICLIISVVFSHSVNAGIKKAHQGFLARTFIYNDIGLEICRATESFELIADKGEIQNRISDFLVFSVKSPAIFSMLETVINVSTGEVLFYRFLGKRGGRDVEKQIETINK